MTQATVMLPISLLLFSISSGTTLPDPLAAGWKGELVCEQLHADETQRILRCTFPPGVGHERHYHAPHFGYIVEGGRMRITDDEGTQVIETTSGASWVSDGVRWHEVLNVGDTTSVYLIVETLDATAGCGAQVDSLH